MDTKNLSYFSYIYWKEKILYIWGLIYIFILCFFPIPEKKGVRTKGGHDDGKGGYDNSGGMGKSGFGCGSGG